jgi:hypothetical protein
MSQLSRAVLFAVLLVGSYLAWPPLALSDT